MNRRKLSVRTLMCLLACATAACSSDLDQKEIPVREEGERIAITATAGMPQDQPSTRLGFEENTGTNKLKLTWRPVGDPKGKESFSVLSGTGSTTPSTFTMQSMDASGATFTGEIIPAGRTTYYAVYPALAVASPVAATAIPLVMTGQKGDSPDENKVYMYSSSTYTAGGTLNFGFQCLTSIVKATLKFPATLKGKEVSDVTFIATDGLYTKANANITASSVTYKSPTAGSLTLSGTFPLSNDANVETTVYLHVLPGTLTDFKIKAKVNGNSYTGTIAASTKIDAGKMYKTEKVEMIHTLDDAKLGDFYCKGSDNKGYLLPGNETLTQEQQNACVGIVFWVGSEALNNDPLLKSKHSDCSHGLVVALQNADAGTTWSTKYEYVQEWIKKNSTYKSMANVQERNKMCGYSNTLALTEYNQAMAKNAATSDYLVLPCKAIQQYSPSAPANSSGWYLPSILELKYVYLGQGQQVQGTTGWEYLNTKIDKITGGTPFDGNGYWSSTEDDLCNYFGWYVIFRTGAVGYNNKHLEICQVRPILAF